MNKRVLIAWGAVIAILLVVWFSFLNQIIPGVFKKGPAIVKIGYNKITPVDFKNFVSDMGLKYSLLNKKSKKELLDNWITTKLFYLEGRSIHITHDKKFSHQIKRKLRYYKEKLYADAVFQKMILSKIKVTDDEIKRYYNEQKENLFKVSEPLVWLKVVYAPDKKSAEMIVAKLRKGANIDVVIKENMPKENVGYEPDLGYMKISSLTKELKKAVLSAPNGYILPPVKYVDKNGRISYYVFKIMDKVWKNGYMKLSAVRNVIINEIKRIKTKIESERLLKKLKKKYHVQYVKEDLL